MTKDELKDFMVVENRDGVRYIVNTHTRELIGSSYQADMSTYNNDLTSRCCSRGDIVRVYKVESYTMVRFVTYMYGSDTGVDLIWERDDTVEMTIGEIEEKLGIKNLKIIKEED